jgi:membrane protein required for colicin V production
MHPYDIVMIVILLGTTLFGLYKGMAWQIASLTSLILSYFVALKFSDTLMQALGWNEKWERFAAMLILYLATSFLVWAIFRLVSSAIDRVKLKEFDRQIGALFGAAKGILFCVVVTFFVVTLSANGRAAVLNSRSGFYIAALLDEAHGVMPKELHEVLHPYMHRLETELHSGEAPHEEIARTLTDLVPGRTPGTPDVEETPIDRLLDRIFGRRESE